MSLFNTIDKEAENLRQAHELKDTKAFNKSKNTIKKNKIKLLELGITEETFEELLKNKFEVSKEMKFDVVIGNPPYQEDTEGGGNKTRGLPLYDKFITSAQSLADTVSMITPVRWYTQRDKSFEDLRKTMLNGQLEKIVYFKDSADCFETGVSIAGGVSYWVWVKDRIGNTVEFQQKQEIRGVCTILKNMMYI